jgi:hypothetical protein
MNDQCHEHFNKHHPDPAPQHGRRPAGLGDHHDRDRSRCDGAPNLAGPAHVGANCQTDPWGFLGSQRRTLCDGPISSDGSWSRERTIWAPAHYSTPICTSRSGSSSSSYTSCSGGYYIDERLIGNETYPVRPDTVLADEPGHLG